MLDVANKGSRPAKCCNLIVWCLFALMLILAPWFFHQGKALTVLSQMGILMILGLSFNMLLGQGGMLSLGHSVYSGLGAFFTIHAIRMVNAGTLFFPMTLLPLIGGLAGMVFGMLFGYLITKKSGTTFSMITLGMVELVFAGVSMFPDFFGGEGGIAANRMTGQPFMGITYGTDIQVCYLIAFWLFISTAAMFAFTKTPLGRMLNAVRDNPERVEFIGYDARWIRYLTFILAAFFAGISGGLSAINFEMVTAENVGAVRSGTILLFTFIGGIGFFWGPMVGVFVGVLLSQVLGQMSHAWQLYLGIFFVFIVMFAPGGIANFLAQQYRVAVHKKYGVIGATLSVLCLTTLLAIAGAVLMIEMTYHLRLDSADATVMSLFGVSIDAARPVFWLVAGLMLCAGALGYQYVQPLFQRKWDAANVETNADVDAQIRETKT